MWERRRLRSTREQEKEKENKAADQDFGALLEKYKQIQEKLADIRKEEESVLKRHDRIIEDENEISKDDKGLETNVDSPQVSELESCDHWTDQPGKVWPAIGSSLSCDIWDRWSIGSDRAEMCI